jgi:cytochrome c oxidase subunit 2
VRMPLFRKPKQGKKWLAAITGLLMASILLSACGGNASILDTYGPIANQERDLFYVILGIATFIFVGVEAALIYSIIRFRERPGMANPRQIHGNLTIEIVWTVIPALILFIVLGFTIKYLFAVSAAPTSGRTVNVEVVGHQWWWEFYYPDYNITTADSLYAPVNTNIHVTLFSNNVIHSFWVPQLTGKTDVIPGHNNEKYFLANKPGTYIGECTEYCGVQHGHMDFNVVILPSMDQFNTWVTIQQQKAVTPPAGSLAAQGAQVFQNLCTSCHGIVGVDVKGYYDPAVDCASATSQPTDVEECKVGPNLTHFGSRTLIAGGVLTNNAQDCNPETQSFNDLLKTCHLAQWLNDPQGVKPGNDMQIGQLTPTQIQQLVAYLESLQ